MIELDFVRTECQYIVFVILALFILIYDKLHQCVFYQLRKLNYWNNLVMWLGTLNLLGTIAYFECSRLNWMLLNDIFIGYETPSHRYSHIDTDTKHDIDN